MHTIRIGTCGYRDYDPEEGWKDDYESKLQAYSDAFAVGELNRTFYELPQVSTTERWRREAVDDFEFTLKAWQAITHPWRSPTWNSHRDAVSEDRTDELGYLRSTEFVEEAWKRTRKRADALDAGVVVIQTPPSFDYSEDHEANVRDFFAEADRGGFDVGWGPRGDWPDHPDRVGAICDDFDLIHVVDLMRDDPLTDRSAVYTRLHGLNDDPYDYDYDYSADELDELAVKLREYAASHERVYCLFNNYEMYPNARSLRTRLGR
ncbi:DUF72 domain-containing protein [Haloplanus sp. GCM10025708]|uniref:DUF72 domain-containing protein n=1 Tax=Haloferacaceae TaxID=1644056 RepID=UPI00361020DF